MKTPVVDFLRAYAASNQSRFHMPGHKGQPVLGCEPWDITEISGADSLYEASGILAQSEQHASELFGSARTLFSTEGSSQCVRAMLYLALHNRPVNTPPVVVAARNVHKSFVSAAALLDLEPVWLWPETNRSSLCACPVTAAGLEKTLQTLSTPPAAVYVTSPDYLGEMLDLTALAEVCHKNHTVLLVDNAHGAYLHFCPPTLPPLHPLDCGADLCCDSAHKSLPVLTGGAYLHIGKQAPPAFSADAKSAMALFGSTSPSYLILASLDACNRILAENFPGRLQTSIQRLSAIKQELSRTGWRLTGQEPMKLTLDAARSGHSGIELADRLRRGGIEWEYADPDFVTLLASPDNTAADWDKILPALGENPAQAGKPFSWPVWTPERQMSIREALFAPHVTVPAADAAGRICGAPSVSCPPAVPIVVSGEIIDPEAIALFAHYGIHTVTVVQETR